ncbi:isoniazid response ATPase/transcriptional regulator IniR [Mycolicibacterium palauense]|uniref:isoniazid response ATPase/transcriptional regulator IniR n=1 Tax=Mycolicibacterium palauense TaxID=2034511 RepID=UPI000BFEDFB7|nr:isoniazid response ATPase/transcriptional regulator IniR [Mycolicibacterium palauense]
MTDLPPAARAALQPVLDDPSEPVKLLVVGGIGTGKSTVLGRLRAALRAAGIAVSTRVPAPGERPAAIVVDDAHLLSDGELAVLTALASDPAVTVVVAAEAHEHCAALRVLATAIEREHPRVALGGWPRAECARHARTEDPAAVSALVAATAGLPFLLDAVGTETDPQTVSRSVVFALATRLRRLDEPVLDTLLVMSLAAALGPADVAGALGTDLRDARAWVDHAYATGLLEPGHGDHFRGLVHDAVVRLVGAARHHEVEAALFRSQSESATLTDELALRLTEHGVRDPALVTLLAGGAARRLDSPAEAARIYRAAVDAGADELAVPLADALAAAGDCAGAAALSDVLLGSEDPARRAAAVRIAAAVAMHDGNGGQAAELFDWLAIQPHPYPDAATAAAAAIVATGTGNPAGAHAALREHDAGPPTSAARAARNLADGVLLTLDRPYPVAMARLSQSIGPADTRAGGEAMPDSPAALVTLAALHSGDPVRARSVIGRAVRDAGGDALFGHRHRLLLAWVKMQDGQLSAAAADAAAVPTSGLHRRDALWAGALHTGIARRSGDAGALTQHWFAAMEVLAEYAIDLFSLLPLGELWVAAARMRQADRLQHSLDQAFALLAALGEPAGWSLPLRWAGVHAAILANSPQSMAPHGQALAAAAGDNGFARALAAGGRAWLRVLGGQVAVDDVGVAARELSQYGLTWDATRLAGQAALQTTDARVSAAMLQVARDLKTAAGQDLPDGDDRPGGDPPTPVPAPGAAAVPTVRAPALSEREREVAELLLLGMPYRDIGAQLFISAKTVEHHVARIRRRLGAESRSEMLSMLRAMLAPNA